MKCNKVKSLLSKFLTNDLPIAEYQQLEDHLNNCLKCQRELEKFKKTFILFSPINLDWNSSFQSRNFLLELHNRIELDNIYSKRHLIKLIPVFTSLIFLLISIVIYIHERINNNGLYQIYPINEFIDNRITITEYLKELDTTFQYFIVDNILKNISNDDLILLDKILNYNYTEDDWLINMDITDKEFFINQIVLQYQEVKKKINLDWIMFDPTELISTSWGG
ncbi:MAG: zf-HC2 domain-containing protein [candidate division WOR-3 bacterium]